MAYPTWVTRAQREPKHPHPQWHDSKIRAILSDAGYHVARTGGWTPRAAQAWTHYLQNKRGGVATRQAANDWNKSPVGRKVSAEGAGQAPVGPQPGSRRGGAYAPGSKGGDKYGRGLQPKGDIRVPGSTHKVSRTNPPKGDTKAPPHGNSMNKSSGVKTSLGGLSRSAAVNKLIGPGYAEKVAGLQFDPSIHEARVQQARGSADAAQHQADISGWGSRVAQAQQAAAGADKAAGAQAQGQLQSTIAGIMNALGGSRGAGVAGAAGATAAGQLAETVAGQDTLGAKLAPDLAAQSADQSARQRALDSQSANALAAQLVDLQGQRGQAKAKAAMDILVANNQARQSNFGNQLALVNTDLAAQNAGLDQLKTMATLSGMRQDQKLKAQQVALAKQQASGKMDWHKLTPDDRQSIVDNAIATAAGQLPPGVYDPTHILNSALATIRGGGFASARKSGYKGKLPSKANQASILGLLQQRLAYYHGQHPQQ